MINENNFVMMLSRSKRLKSVKTNLTLLNARKHLPLYQHFYTTDASLLQVRIRKRKVQVRLKFEWWFSYNRNKALHELIQRWLDGLPSLLVQLKNNSPSLTELILGILKKALMQKRLIPESNIFQYLATFFCK